MNQEIMKPTAGMTARQDLGGQEITVSGETASTVLAARAKAMVEARFVMAMNNRRNIKDVRRKLLDACERDGFAGSATEKGSGWYRRPRGKSGFDEGFSIRFAEEAIRALGNIDCSSTVIYDDEERRMIEVGVLDLENNNSIPATIIIEKVVERSYIGKHEEKLSMRLNSYGKPVYTRRATEDEFRAKQNSEVSKAIRTGALRLLPGDIQDECRASILRKINGEVAQDPNKFQKKIVDGFSKHGVTAAAIEKYLDHEIDSCSETQLIQLRDIWKAIDAGDLTWHQVVTDAAAEKGEDAPEKDNRSSMERVTDELKTAEKPVEAVKFEPRKEMNSIAKLMFRAKWEEALNHRVEKHGWTGADLTDEQISTLIDELQGEQK